MEGRNGWNEYGMYVYMYFATCTVLYILYKLCIMDYGVEHISKLSLLSNGTHEQSRSHMSPFWSLSSLSSAYYGLVHRKGNNNFVCC